MNREKEPELALSENELVPCGIYIDQEGDWYYRGSVMQRGDIVSHLCQHLRREELSERYIIQMGKQRCYLDVEDTPLVVTSVFQEKAREEEGQERFYLSIKHLPIREPLNPRTLWVGQGNVLYCKVKEDTIPARFLRPAYYQLAEFIQEDEKDHRFYLSLGKDRYYIG